MAIPLGYVDLLRPWSRLTVCEQCLKLVINYGLYLSWCLFPGVDLIITVMKYHLVQVHCGLVSSIWYNAS